MGYVPLNLISSVLHFRLPSLTAFMMNSSGDPSLSMMRTHQDVNAHLDACNYIGDPQLLRIDSLRSQCRDQAHSSTWLMTYFHVSPDVHCHEIYTNCCNYIHSWQGQGVIFSSSWLSSHRLCIETGCLFITMNMDINVTLPLPDSIQDGEHILLYGYSTKNLWENSALPDFVTIRNENLWIFALYILRFHIIHHMTLIL